MPIRSGKLRNEELIGDLRTGMFEPATLAVEMISSYGMPVGREVSDTVL